MRQKTPYMIGKQEAQRIQNEVRKRNASERAIVNAEPIRDSEKLRELITATGEQTFGTALVWIQRHRRSK